MSTRCAPCDNGDHGLCQGIVPRAVDGLGRAVDRAGFLDCRCLCDLREIAAEHLRHAAKATEDGNVEEARLHLAAVHELLGDALFTPPAPRRLALRFYEHALPRGVGR